MKNKELKEKKMEFKKENIFTTVNADELRPGDKVIVAHTFGHLKHYVEQCAKPNTTVKEVLDEDNPNRFVTRSGEAFPLAYLVERAENCTNCGNCGSAYCSCFTRDKSVDELSRTVCDEYIRLSEQKAEPHYRPFKDTDELQQIWGSRCSEGKGYILNSLDMPHIWVRYKKEAGSKSKGHLIHGFYEDIIEIQDRTMSMEDLFYFCEFLDGSPCGVEE